MMMMKKMMMKVFVLVLMLTVRISQSSDVVEDLQSDLKVALPQHADYTLLMMLAVLCGAGLVGILVALVHVIRPPPLFTLRSATNNDHNQHGGPAFKLFDRIDEFH